ncbi:plasmid replication initiator TrfA (plasmid) [Pseudoduganella sp. UC29_106]|uniref:plasmid replication initiator TrfA n=1 Tax=Pseudoduganella sp. UC29_106 TaxID=3374553 RepID=UPI003756B694
MTDQPPKTRKPKTPPTKQMELFLEDWPDRVRGVPNVVLRSALFSISKKRDTYKKLTLIASNDGLEIRRRGEQFNQDDLDVWQVLVHLARKQPLNTYVRFTVNSVLTELGLPHGGTQHNQLREAIARLMGGPIEIRWVNEGKVLMDTLIKKKLLRREDRNLCADPQRRIAQALQVRLDAN